MDDFYTKLDKLIKSVISLAVPNESLKKSDFNQSIKTLQDKIIDTFRYCTLDFFPPFFNKILNTINQNTYSQDKKTRFSAAICITALINLFPNDEDVVPYQPIIENLLMPGYRPMIDIGALVLDRFARISGPNRDRFLSHLILECRAISDHSKSPEEKYKSAVIWKELAHSYPEGFYKNMRRTFCDDFFKCIENDKNEKVIYYLLIGTITELFRSEAASVGVSFLENLHESILNKTVEIFSNGNVDKMPVIFDLLLVILDIPPSINKSIADQIYPKLIEGINSKKVEVAKNSVDVIIYLLKNGLHQISEKLIHELFDRLISHVKNDCYRVEPTLIKLFSFISDYNYLYEKIYQIYKNLPKKDAAYYTSNLIIAALSIRRIEQPKNFFELIKKCNEESRVPINLHSLLEVLNNLYHETDRSQHNDLINEYNMLVNVIISSVRQELSKTIFLTDPTDRLIISLKTIILHSSFEYSNALEFKNLIMKLTNNKDFELRELIVESIISLFNNNLDNIPFDLIFDLVRFALNDPVNSVRMKSLEVFSKASLAHYLQQQDIFEEFCKFLFDEHPEIRKKALSIIKNLKSFDLSIMRNLLLTSIDLIDTNFTIIVPENTPVWIVFPNLIETSKPIIHIYAESFFSIFYKILINQFINKKTDNSSIALIDSAILKEIDESLIKSVTKLYLLCPQIISVKPILDIFSLILKKRVHPWTKENVLKSLKNVAEVTDIINICPTILNALQTVISQKESIKLVTKALKVMGVIGVAEIPINSEKEPFFLRSTLTNPLYFNQYMLQVYFKYLNDFVDSNNIDSSRIKIVSTISQAYKADIIGIQHHLEPFFTKYLNFIKNLTTENVPDFLSYLKKIISYAGYLIMPYPDRIFQAVEDHWYNQYTKETSQVLTQLVISTEGRCDSILHLLVSASFKIIRSLKEDQSTSEELFIILRTIAQFCPGHLQSIVDGAVKILKIPGSPVYQQQQSLDLIEFIITNTDAWPHLSMITRCLNGVSNRSQMVWRDKANKLLNIIHIINEKHFDVHTIHNNFKSKNSKNNNDNNHLLLDMNNYYYTNTAENFNDYVKKCNFQTNFEFLLSKFDPPIKDDTNTQFLLNWFDILCKYLIVCSQSDVIKSMINLPALPDFSFKFAFYIVWSHLSQAEKKEIVNKLNEIFTKSYLPSSIMSKFIGIVEFAVLAEINLGVDLGVVINCCISYKFYTMACFFLENHPDPNVLDSYIQKLINLNIALCRNDEARCLANSISDRLKVDISVWMALNEWEEALEIINEFASNEQKKSISEITTSSTNQNSSQNKSKEEIPKIDFDDDNSEESNELESCYKSDDSEEYSSPNNVNNENSSNNNTVVYPSDNNNSSESIKRSALVANTSNFILNKCINEKLLIKSVRCLASLENWKEIKKIKPILLSQRNQIRYKLARFMWMSELYQGTRKEAFECIKLTGGYTVADCIDKSIMYIHFSMYDEAKKCYHLAWRYLASSICNININNKQQMNYHIFQAEQLHELSEVIELRKNASFKKDVIAKTWMNRLRFIKEDPEKQKELFKIRSLVSHMIDLTEFAYNILKSTKRTSKGTEKLIDLFFPDPTSYDSKYCRIKLIEDKEERIKEAKKLVQSIPKENNEKIIKRLNYFIGKESFKIASNYHDLDNVSKYLILGKKKYNLLVQVQIIRAFLKLDENIAVSAIIEYLQNCKNLNIAIILHQLEAMTIHFPYSNKVCQAVIERYRSSLIKPSDLKYIKRSCVLSLNNKSKLIVEAAKTVCSILATQIPESIIYDLISYKKKYPEQKAINDLLNVLQSSNPLFFSQITRIIKKLESISISLYDEIIKNLKDCYKEMNNSHFNDAYRIIKQMSKTLKQTFVAKYDNDFRTRFLNKSEQIIEHLINKINLDDHDKQIIQKLIISTVKNQEYTRVIPLASLDVELSTQTNWPIPIFGKDNTNDIKISHFFHSVQRLDNGLRISVIGSNGKKYNYHLIREERYHANQSEQFMTLLNTIIPFQLAQRSLIEINPQLTLTELLKGRIQLFDLISMYQQSKGQNPDEKFLRISDIYLKLPPKKLTTQLKKKIGVNDIDNLKKVLLITSETATNYINRTTMFAKTMGTLSAVSYIIGGADNSPRGILIDKASGEVTYSNFRVTGFSQEVPFRLTRMIVSAFGPCGVKGPFFTSLVKSLESVRKCKNGLATAIQFALGDQPFNKEQLPMQYLDKYKSVQIELKKFTPSDSLFSPSSSVDSETEDEIDLNGQNEIQRTDSPLIAEQFDFESENSIKSLNEKTESEDALDQFYIRISGNQNDLNSEVNYLIKKAQSFEKLAAMPVTFYAWW